MITEIYDIAVMVSSAKKSMEWYEKKLGFEVIDKEGHWITVAPKGSKTLLHLCEASERHALEPGNQGIAFGVDDLDKTYEELSKRGVEFIQKPEDKGWGKYATLKDIDGNEFTLFE